MDTNIAELVAKYVQIRDEKARIKKEQDAVMSRIQRALNRIEETLLETLREQGAESIRTPNGTCYQSTQTSVKVEDRDSFLSFVETNQAWSFLESRANKTAVEEYLAENQELPPGLTVTRRAVVGVRRS